MKHFFKKQFSYSIRFLFVFKKIFVFTETVVTRNGKKNVSVSCDHAETKVKLP